MKLAALFLAALATGVSAHCEQNVYHDDLTLIYLCRSIYLFDHWVDDNVPVSVCAAEYQHQLACVFFSYPE